jgi:hypothetical protein
LFVIWQLRHAYLYNAALIVSRFSNRLNKNNVYSHVPSEPVTLDGLSAYKKIVDWVYWEHMDLQKMKQQEAGKCDIINWPSVYTKNEQKNQGNCYRGKIEEIKINTEM